MIPVPSQEQGCAANVDDREVRIDAGGARRMESTMERDTESRVNDKVENKAEDKIERERDRALDQALEETFPGSDPVNATQPPKSKHERRNEKSDKSGGRSA
jgi:hypothetical protein